MALKKQISCAAFFSFILVSYCEAESLKFLGFQLTMPENYASISNTDDLSEFRMVSFDEKKGKLGEVRYSKYSNYGWAISNTEGHGGYTCLNSCNFGDIHVHSWRAEVEPYFLYFSITDTLNVITIFDDVKLFNKWLGEMGASEECYLSVEQP